MKVFRTLWCTDSDRKSDSAEAIDVDECDLGSELLSIKGAYGEGCARHSGLSMIPTIAWRICGLSDPEIDWLFLPLIISSNPVHHLFKMLVRRSRSSGLILVLEGCDA